MKKYILFISIGIIVLASVVAFMQWAARPKPTAALEGFAECLTAKGVKMYGAYWCPHCQNQKEIFGDSFKHITYIECASNENLKKKTCEQAGIQGFPTWVFADGSRLEGEKSLEILSEKSQCALPTEQK